MMRRRIEFWTFMLCLLFAPVYLLAAQETLPAAPDYRTWIAQAIEALTPVLSFVIVWGVKVLWNKIPGSLVLFIGPVVGMGLNWLLSFVGTQVPASLIHAALLGAVATWVREIISTISDKGLLGGVTRTKNMV